MKEMVDKKKKKKTLAEAKKTAAVEFEDRTHKSVRY